MVLRQMLAMTSVRGLGALPELLNVTCRSEVTTALFSDLGLPINVLSEEDRMIPLNALFAVYEAASEITGDPLTGLKVGQQMQDGFGAWVGYTRQAENLRLGLEAAIKALRYHQSGARLVLSSNGSLSRLAYCVEKPRPSARLQHFLHILPAIIKTFQTYTGDAWQPIALEFDCDYSQQIDLIQQALQVRVLCRQPEMALVFSTCDLLCANSKIALGYNDVDIAHLKSIIQGRPPREFVDIVHALIDLRLSEGYPDIESTARQMGLSVRSLQRALLNSLTNYREAVTEVRIRRCKKMLETTEQSITEIAFELGYEDPAHLSRAFSVCTGMSPSSYRAQIRTVSGD